ncbi:phage tail tube protein [Schleiferilactobacillus harbinensis]|uniref:Phage tail protein n=1 Tax=Schleiferilactobacillus harbinensis TaxID=304207 RepID=A0A5P8M6E9_9LACO|nr:hypothetical protein [Schleiferilactobacillus harbinensis]QFR24086.1 hypothetical protein D1010_12215 [Schleiferilactobacillus harbinensis]
MADQTQSPTKNVNYLGDILENYLTEYWIGLKPNKTGDPINWLYLADGITTVTPKYTDKKKTAAYYNGGGNERSTVTGVTSSYDISGDRSYHNPAQDAIANLKLATGSRREQWFRRNEYLQNNDGSLTLIKSETGMATWTDIDDGGGAADDNGGFKVTATYLSTPSITKESDIAELNEILLKTPCQNANILHVAVVQPQADGSSKTYQPDPEVADTSNGDPANSQPAAGYDVAQGLADGLDSDAGTPPATKPDTPQPQSTPTDTGAVVDSK